MRPFFLRSIVCANSSDLYQGIASAMPQRGRLFMPLQGPRLDCDFAFLGRISPGANSAV